MSFSPARFPALTIRRPRIWWPYQLGGQPLYTLATSVSQGGKTLNTTSEQFGIRTVTSSLVGPSPEAPHGVRSFAPDHVSDLPEKLVLSRCTTEKECSGRNGENN